jgi:hypothetical protein
MKAAIYNGVFNKNATDSSSLPMSCSTGNCTWPLFLSLAVCSKCANITNLVRHNCTDREYEERYCDYSLPNGQVAIGASGLPETMVVTAMPASNTTSFQNITNSLVAFSIMRTTETWDLYDPEAIECVLYYCVQQYNASVSGGVLTQEVTHMYTNSTDAGFSEDVIITPPPSAEFPLPDTFDILSQSAAALYAYLGSIFTGTDTSSTGEDQFNSDITQALHQTTDIPGLIANLAASMTNNMRTNSDQINGTAWKTDTYVRVRWAWLTLPAGSVLLTFIFLLGSILRNRNRDVATWKSSVLAVLFHGLDEETRDFIGEGGETMEEIKKKAKQVSVWLKESYSGTSLSYL